VTLWLQSELEARGVDSFDMFQVVECDIIYRNSKILGMKIKELLKFIDYLQSTEKSVARKFSPILTRETPLGEHVP